MKHKEGNLTGNFCLCDI